MASVVRPNAEWEEEQIPRARFQTCLLAYYIVGQGLRQQKEEKEEEEEDLHKIRDIELTARQLLLSPSL